MSTGKTPFGRALASVRAGRGMTAADLAAELGVNANAISSIETGRRCIDGRLIDAIDAAIMLSDDERLRLASGMSASGLAGDDVRYVIDLHDVDGPEAHRAAGLLAAFGQIVEESAWGEIAAIVHRRIGDSSAAARTAA